MTRRKSGEHRLRLAAIGGGLIFFGLFMSNRGGRMAPAVSPATGMAILFGLTFVVFALAKPIVAILRAITSPHRNRAELGALKSEVGPGSPTSPVRISSPAGEPLEFSHGLLHALEWRRFEEVASCYFELLGFRARTSRVGADGGIDVTLFREGDEKPSAVVQCKAWSSYKIGVKPVRELFGVMTAESAPAGVFLTTSTFTEEATAFAVGKPIELIDGALFLGQIRRLPADAQARLLKVATAGDYATPTCPNCACKMVERTAKKGAAAGSKFWGCRNYPRCRRTFQISKDVVSAQSIDTVAHRVAERIRLTHAG